MKRLFSIITAISAISATYADGDGDAFDAILQWDTREVKIGVLNTSEPTRSFTFVGINAGNAPLVLTYVHPSCNCVRLQYPREPIAPGDTLRIRGTLNPHGLSDGPFRRDIIVRSNATESKIRLLITGTIQSDSIR